MGQLVDNNRGQVGTFANTALSFPPTLYCLILRVNLQRLSTQRPSEDDKCSSRAASHELLGPSVIATQPAAQIRPSLHNCYHKACSYSKILIGRVALVAQRSNNSRCNVGPDHGGLKQSVDLAECDLQFTAMQMLT